MNSRIQGSDVCLDGKGLHFEDEGSEAQEVKGAQNPLDDSRSQLNHR